MKPAYGTLAIAISINLVVMFFLTYAMIDTTDHFYANINRAYMAVLMAAPMVVVMLLLMPKMFPDAKRNAVLYAVACGGFALVFWLMRTQTPVGDAQFLRSMIPHHSSAIVMCEEAAIADPEIRALCVEIVRAQKEEIAQMQRILERY